MSGTDDAKKGKQKAVIEKPVPDEFLEIRPVYNKDYDPRDSKLPNPKMLRKNTRVGVIGKTGSGKTQAVVNMLLDGMPEYENIVIWALNPNQSVYKGLEESIKDLIEDETLGFVKVKEAKEMPKITEFEEDFPSVIIFDDLQSQDTAVKRIISEFFTAGRPRKISCFYLAQNYSGMGNVGVPTTIRENCDCWMLFALISDQRLKAISETLPLPVSFKTLKVLYQMATGKNSKKGDFLFIDLENEDKSLMFRKNLTEPLPWEELEEQLSKK